MLSAPGYHKVSACFFHCSSFLNLLIQPHEEYNGSKDRKMTKAEEDIKRRLGAVNFELRKYPRYSLELPIEYWETDLPQNHRGRTGNVSQGGLMLFVTEEMEIGRNLRVKIFFGSSLSFGFIEAQVEVVWRDMHWMSEEDYRIGVKFVDISSEERGRLEDLLKKTSLLRPPQN